MYQGPVQFIIALFQDEEAAQSAYLELQDAQEEKELTGLQEAAVIRKDTEGKAHVWEDQDLSGGEGAMFGGVVGAVAGLILGPGAIITGIAGAAIGGLIAKLDDSGFDNKSLKSLANSLTPGSSALLVAVDDVALSRFSQRLEASGAKIITEHMEGEIAQKLQEEYTALIASLKNIGPEGLLAEDPDEIARKVDALKDQTIDEYGLDSARRSLM